MTLRERVKECGISPPASRSLDPRWVSRLKKRNQGEVKSSKRTPGFVGAFDKRALFSAITQAVLDGPPECRGGRTGEVGLPIDGGARG